MPTRHRNSDRSGAAVVELAVTLPVIFFVVLATVEICNGIFLRQSLEVMAFEGARVSVTPDALTTDIEEQVAAIAAARNVDVISVKVSPANFEAQSVGSFIEVHVVGSCDSAAGIFGDGIAEAKVSMMKNY